MVYFFLTLPGDFRYRPNAEIYFFINSSYVYIENTLIFPSGYIYCVL
jgi:hypothetical protein